VIIGPNNSGKSTIFQALCLWETGVKNFIAAYKKSDLDKWGNVTLNRKDLLNSLVSDARFLWQNKKVSSGQKHIPLSIELQGENNGKSWICKAEFIFDNTESFSCKIVSGVQDVIELYNDNNGIHFGYLQAMSEISISEDKFTQGSIDRKLGEGKTAEVLRNICYQILFPEIKSKESADMEKSWTELCNIVERMFGAKLERPEFIKSTGLISLEYTENGIKYDISSGGRGFQQTLLLFAYMFANPNTVLLLDEPDAHLEVIRQREIFQQINAVANEMNTQFIVASHSEVILNEAADSSKVIALIENQALELNTSTKNKSIGYIRKALTDIGWEKYYLAKTKGHIIYLEGSTDLQMLLAFATKLQHKVEPLLRQANVDYTADNVPNTAIANFVALKEIFPELKGLALFDRIEKNIDDIKPLKIICWQNRELENYFARPDLLIKHAGLLSNQYSQFTHKELEKTMQQVISDYTLPAYLKNLNDPWWNDAKLSDDWLGKIFPEFYKRLNINVGSNFKKYYYLLISLIDRKVILTEISEKLDSIYEILK
jgi:ABC-type cobalamin/Fe3+-siderophores transport system ATPase subunit